MVLHDHILMAYGVRGRSYPEAVVRFHVYGRDVCKFVIICTQKRGCNLSTTFALGPEKFVLSYTI